MGLLIWSHVQYFTPLPSHVPTYMVTCILYISPSLTPHVGLLIWSRVHCTGRRRVVDPKIHKWFYYLTPYLTHYYNQYCRSMVFYGCGPESGPHFQNVRLRHINICIFKISLNLTSSLTKKTDLICKRNIGNFSVRIFVRIIQVNAVKQGAFLPLLRKIVRHSNL